MGLAHVGVGADFDVLQAQVAGTEVVQHTFGQTELRDAVAQHAADLIVAFKNGHIVAVAGQDDRGWSKPAGPLPMMADLLPLGGGGTLVIWLGVGRGNVVLDDRESARVRP